jgi:hypothetical protein
MKALIISLLLGLLPAPAWSGTMAHDACRGLCEGESDCLRRCVSHVELFELSADFVNACAAFHSDPEVRLKVLRSGATRDLFPLCKDTGWGIDNVLTCLRSLPTPEVIKACKKLSPKEEDQVRCLRSGTTHVQIEACRNFGATPSERLQCLDYHLDAHVARRCSQGKNTEAQRLQCLNQAKADFDAETRKFENEARKRILAEDAEKKRLQERRMPASTKPSKKLNQDSDSANP